MTAATHARWSRSIPFAEINTAADPRAVEIARTWLPGGKLDNTRWMALNPTRNDTKLGSFGVEVAGPNVGKWADFATGDKGGDLISLGKMLFGWSMAESARVVAALVGHPFGDSYSKARLGKLTCRSVQHDREPRFSMRDGDDPNVLVRPVSRTTAKDRPDRDYTKRTGAALAIWQSATPADGTIVETYLDSRGLPLAPPPTLRFHAGLKHPSGGSWPAMIALVTRGSDDKPLAIHRTFLARDGGGKAPVDPSKMMLGPCRGGAVRLGEPGNVLMVGEGIETCLAAMQATGNPAWAALSTSGLRNLELPSERREIIVLADGDDPGEAAARDCAWRWKREGRRVRIARPPRGMDFNDMLMGRANRTEEGSQ